MSPPLLPRDTGRGQLLGVKLSIPRTSDTFVQRSRILAVLDTVTDVPLTVVTAPAGYGKTTAVAQWATMVDHPVSWISLGPEDNNPLKFLAYLIASVQAADPDSLREALEHASVHLDWRETLDRVIAAMELATRHFVLVLDDFHTLSNPQLLRAFTFLINHLPPQAHLVLISRTPPNLPLGRLRANRALGELAVAELAFSTEEALAFRAASGLDEVDEEQWAAVATMTEGWVAGMQLARLSLAGQDPATVKRFVSGFNGRLQEVDDYLVEEVIVALPADLRDFVLRSSILPFLAPELCDYVFETDRSTHLMRELRQRSLFVVSFGPQLQWLRYHHLFADALQQQLADETEPGEIAALHHRAAEWLGENGHEEQALGHAIACQRWDVATALMHRICAPLTVSDRMVSMRYWLDLLPKDMVMGDPELRYLLLWSLAISADFTVNAEQLALIDSDSPDPTYQARTHSIRMQTSYALGDVDGIRHNALQVIEQTTPDMVPARINARISEATSRYLVGEFEEADDAFAEVRRLIALEPEPWLEHRGELRYVDALCLQGRLDDAETLLGQIATTMLLSPQVADTQVGWFKASIHLERNELDLADVALAKAFDNAEATRADRWMPPILITRAMVDWARGNTGAAHTNAELARRTAKALGNPNFAQRAEALQAMMWIATGQHILAERWLATAALNLTWVREFNQPYPALAAVRLLVARGELEQALARLDEIITATRNYRRTGDLVRLHALKAGLLVRCNKVDHGARELATAIDLGAQGGFVRSFLDEGTAIAGLFNHPYIREHTHPHYAQSIKRAFDSKSVGLSHAHQSQVEALSLRELDVLRLVATGQSNRSIATSLFISEPTVKKHLSNIMSKLDVLNRTQAVSFAREMGLI